MKPPTCKACGSEHWSTQPHVRTKKPVPQGGRNPSPKPTAAPKKKPRHKTGAKV